MEAANPESDPPRLRAPSRLPSRLIVLAALAGLGVALLVSGFGFLEWRRSGVVTVGGDLDPYVRLVRISRLLSTGAWLDSSIPNSHLGRPEEVAWTRPLDLLVLPLFLVLRPLLPQRDALLLAGAVLSPLLWAASLPLWILALRQLPLGPFGILCGLLAFVFHPMLVQDFAFGRCDHHALLKLCLLAFLASILRAVGPRARRRDALACGAAAGLGVWVDPEGILVPAVVCGVLGLRWCLRDPRAAPLLRDLSFGALLILVPAIFCEHGPGAFGVVEHDRVSVIHVSLFAAVAALSLVFRRLDPLLRSGSLRLLAAGGLAAAAFGLLELVYPGFHQGPLRAMDPVLRDIWFDHLAQSQPLWQVHQGAPGLGYLVVTVFMGLLALGALWRARSQVAAGDRPGIELLLCATAVTLVLSFGFRRLTTVLAYLYIPGVGLLAEQLWQRLSRSVRGSGFGARMKRLAAVDAILVAAALGPQVLLWTAEASAEPTGASQREVAQAACRSELRRWVQLDRIAELSGRERALVATRPGEAPGLLFWTHHGIVAWNHHRSTRGLLLLERLFGARDDADLWEAARQSGAELVLYCPGSADDEPYWRRDAPAPLPPWISVLAGDRSGDGPVLLALEPPDPASFAAHRRD